MSPPKLSRPHVRALILAGDSDASIARHFCASRQRVSQLRRAMGLFVPPEVVDPIAIRSLAEAGLSSAKIGRVLGVSTHRVATVRYRLNLPDFFEMRKAMVLARIKQRQPLARIAEELGIPAHSVGMICRRAGIYQRKRRSSKVGQRSP